MQKKKFNSLIKCLSFIKLFTNYLFLVKLFIVEFYYDICYIFHSNYILYINSNYKKPNNKDKM